MTVVVREFRPSDLDGAIELWSASDGIGLKVGRSFWERHGFRVVSTWKTWQRRL